MPYTVRGSQYVQDKIVTLVSLQCYAHNCYLSLVVMSTGSVDQF